MKQLTTSHKDFLLDYFFKNEKHAGWKNIAVSLLEKGETIVAGKDCIWSDSFLVRRFIKIEEATDFIGCSKYIFDLEGFLTFSVVKEQLEILTKQEYDEAIRLYDEALNNIVKSMNMFKKHPNGVPDQLNYLFNCTQGNETLWILQKEVNSLKDE